MAQAEAFGPCADQLCRLAKKPEVFFAPDPKVSAKLSQATKVLYDYAQHVATSSTSSLGAPAGLPLLLLDGFDTDQIWAELELYNQPVLKSFTSYADSMQEQPLEEVNEDEESDEDAEEEEEEASMKEDEDASETPDENSDEEDEKDGQTKGQSEAEKKAAALAAWRKRAATLDADMDKDEESDDATDRRDEALEIMERFDAMMEDMDERRARGEENDDDFVDLNADLDEDGGAAQAMTWMDFMTATGDISEPDESGDKKKTNKKKGKVTFADEDEDEDEGQDEDQDMEEKGAPESENEDSEADTTGQEDVEENLSSHEKRKREMQKQIDELEEKILKPREWDQIGEVTAVTRPENSLLEKVLDVNYLGVGQMGDERDEEEADLTIEGMIKQRIKDEAWDDPERKIEEKTKEYRPREDLSMEKSKFGLAEIYEREYLEMQRDDNKTELDDKLAKEHQEISMLFSSLCHQLDALSNFHMTPKPPREEMEVASQPALNMEEAIPLAVSDARTKAPHETFSSTARGAPVARDEMTKAEKTAKRLKKKKRRKKHRKKTDLTAQGAADKQLDEATEVIRLAKNIESVDTSKQINKNFTNSTTFFSEVSSNAASAGPKKKKRKTGNATGAFKL